MACEQKACEQKACEQKAGEQKACARLTSKRAGPRLRTVVTEAWTRYPIRGGGSWWLLLRRGEWWVWMEGRGWQQLTLEYVNQKWFRANNHREGGGDSTSNGWGFSFEWVWGFSFDLAGSSCWRDRDWVPGEKG